jgi:apolipoprotein N-acyltransferase
MSDEVSAGADSEAPPEEGSFAVAGRARRLAPWAAAAAGGALYFLGYAGWEQPLLAWFALVPILWAIAGATPRRAFFLGWFAGWVAHCGGFYWITYTLEQFAAAPRPLAIGGVLLLAAANGLIFALWAWATRRLQRDLGAPLLLAAPAAWAAVEFSVPQLFPNYFAASQYRVPLATQIADLTGVIGVSALLVLANTALFELLAAACPVLFPPDARRPLPRRGLAIAAALIAAALAYGGWRLAEVERRVAAAPTLRIGLVQVNMGAAGRHDDPALWLRRHQEATRRLCRDDADLDLVLWPESACPYRLLGRQGYLPPALLAGAARVPVLMGALFDLDEQLVTSALLLSPKGKILGIYDKQLLIPFGETMPCGERFPFLYDWAPHTANLVPGPRTEPLTLEGWRLSVTVCYEDIQFAFFRERVRDAGAFGPHLLLNITNDSWYGDSVEPLEHLALATFRAIEHRRALVRCTNTGVSAFVDPAGRLVSETRQWQEATLVGDAPLLQGRTLYTLLGDWFGWSALVGVGAALAWGWRRRRQDARAA